MPDTSNLAVSYDEKTILELKQLLEGRHLNLEPGFQRKSVWSPLDRRKLIESILSGYPLPSIFLYKRIVGNHVVYDVVDGKQRLETIFMYCGSRGFAGKRFSVRFALDGTNAEPLDWAVLRRRNMAPRVDMFRLQVVEVGGELSTIIDLFVRINSTGKALKGAEKRHARYYDSQLLTEAERLSRKWRPWFEREKIIPKSQSDRMKDVELLSELLVSITRGGLIDRKVAVDRAIGNESYSGPVLRRGVAELDGTLATMKRLFPDLGQTRFSNISEFYSLTMLVWQFRRDKLILSDRRRAQNAWGILVRLSSAVTMVRERQRKAQGAGPGQNLAADYLMSVQEGTDKLVQRQKRERMLLGLLSGIFEKKDERRGFSREQRRLLWHSEERKVCRKCGVVLTWANFQADHVNAHSRGGRTDLKNAQLLCGRCNRRKGARRAG